MPFQMSTTGVLPAGDVAKESGKRSAEHAARRVEQEDGISDEKETR